MTLNLFELICFDHKQAYVLFFCISVAISWYVKQQSQYLENTIFFLLHMLLPPNSSACSWLN